MTTAPTPLIKLRKQTQTFLIDKTVRAYHCIEILHKRRWRLLGDDVGIIKCRTVDERDAKMAEIMAMAKATNDPSSPTRAVGERPN